jgi:uncharacterized protein (TIGR02594 family)
VAGNDRLERLTKVGRNFANGFTIGAPVGDWARGAKNVPGDVEMVQRLLEFASQRSGRSELSPRGVDGSISRIPGRSSTVRAIRAYQRSFMQDPDGLVEPDGQTLRKLREEVQGADTAGSAAKSVMGASHPSDSLPPWLHTWNRTKVFNAPSLLPDASSDKPMWITVAEKEIGQEEIAGKEHNARIVAYHATTSGKATSDETAWCASFVNWVITQSGYQGAGSAWSHDWKKWGDGLPKPAVGSVAFIDWGKVDSSKKGKGHVGFVVGKTAKGRIVLLGGNQSDQVRYTAFKESLIQTYRVPKGYTPNPKLFDLPVMEISQGGGGFAATR